MASDDTLGSIWEKNNIAVFTTYRKDGRPQMSLVTVARFGDKFAFTTRKRNAKYHNLMRDPRAAMMLLDREFRAYAVIDGDADVLGPHNASPSELSDSLRDVFRTASGKEHPNWAEYDQVMLEQERVVISLKAARSYVH